MGDTQSDDESDRHFMHWIERRRQGQSPYQRTRTSLAAERAVRVYDADLVHLRGLQAQANAARGLLDHHFTLQQARNHVQMDVQLRQSAFPGVPLWFHNNLNFNPGPFGFGNQDRTVVPLEYVPPQHVMPFEWHFDRWARDEQEHAMKRHVWRQNYGTDFPMHPVGPDGMLARVAEVANARDQAQASVDQDMALLRLFYEAEAVDTLAQPTRSRTRPRELEAIEILENLDECYNA